MDVLEDFMINQSVRQAVISKQREWEEGLNNALARLKSEDIPCDLPTLKKIMVSDEAFKAWIDKAEESYIGKLGFLPKEERKRIKETFAGLISRTKNDRANVSGFLSRCPYPIEQDSDGRIYANEEALLADADNRATKRFSEEDREYFSVLMQVREAMNRLYKWEEEHSYTHFSKWSHPVFPAYNKGNGDGSLMLTPPFDAYRTLSSDSFKDWFKARMGVSLGKMNPEAAKMIREMSNED